MWYLFRLIRLPVHAPVLDRFGKMLFTDSFTPLQVGDGPRHLEYTGEGTGRESKTISHQFKHPVASDVQFTMFPEMSGVHLGVAMDLCPLETVVLNITGTFYPEGNSYGTFRLGPVSQIAITNCRNFDVEHPAGKLPIYLIFGSPASDNDKKGNVYYKCPFNLSSVS